MKTLRTFAKIITLALVLSLVFAFASCDFLKGSLKLESFTVDRSSVKTVYYIGEEIDFSGIKATVKYSDESLNVEYTAADLKVTYEEGITDTTGTKPVTVSFEDPHLGITQTTTVQITVKEDPNAVKHDSYVVDASGMKTTYFVGDTLDFTGVKVIEKFTNGGEDVEMTDLSLIEYDYAEDLTSTAGSKNILVSYNGEDAGAITVTVKKPAITAAELDTAGVTLEYKVGDTVSFDGLKAYLTYENGKSGTVTAFSFVTDLETVTESYGTKQITVKISDTVSGTTRNESFEIKVDGIVDYELDTAGAVLSYLENETVSFDGIKVTAKYYYGSKELVALEDLTLVHDDDLTATPGNKQVTVKVGNAVVGSFVITVGDIPTATANTESVDLSYRVGETVSLEGLTVTLKFTDGTPDELKVLSELTVLTDLADLTATPGTKDITVKYVFDAYDVLATVRITVWGIDSYTVDASGMTTDYYIGETVNYSGIKVYANYLDGGDSVLVDPASVSFSDDGITATAGAKAIPVLIDGKSANVSVSVNVVKNNIKTTVVGGDYKSSYEVGDTVDFTGITVTLTYDNGDVYVLELSDLTIGDASTDTAGNDKLVNVKFQDPVNNEESSATFLITVIEARLNVVQFEKPASLSAFDSDNKTEGKLEYGATGFSGEFVNGGILYVIGDDNEFKLLPGFSVQDANGIPVTLTEYYTVVDIYAYNGTEYVLLDKSANSATNYTYTLDGEPIVSVDTYEGIYQFTKPMDKVKISVMPSAEYYNGTETLNPVVLEAKVIDAYNVYEAWQLSVIDNDTSRTDWETFKNERGILNVSPAGIVIHNDIHVSADDVPQSFLYVSDKDITYINTVTGVTQVAPAGTRYLVDFTEVYKRCGAADFTIQGNFFAIDTIKFPLVPSPSVFDKSLDRDYGSDYSNATLFMFETITGNFVPKKDVSDIAYVTVENIHLIGNASRDNWVVDDDYDTELVTAGGLIMLKSTRHTETTLNNVINNSFFISYFPDYQGTLIVNDSKCYDSYQNAAFVWADTKLLLNNSYLSGAGGPLVIAQSVKEDNVYYNPIAVATNTVFETHVNGEEVWFKAVGATSLVGQMKALSSGLDQLVTTATDGAMSSSWVDDDGEMNIIATLMPRATSANDLNDAMIQGTVSIDGTGIDRWQTEELWYKILTHPAFSNAAPFLTVYDQNGTAHTIWTDQTNFYDLAGNQIGTQESHQALVMAFATADRIILHQGGLSVIFELYH